ncbi:hypothetical protein [Thauera aromatica]|uniref:hypothetical protein n=1 Tax=Thauera aromatica TaxID=59405 RepID=UPI001FFD3AF7|nr:hypothetical protein [Thauera aromatica]MCK2097536.1 hypothetical protein [Thauera aromatica]
MTSAAQRIESIGKRITGRTASADGTAWAKTPPSGGARGTPWEKAILGLAESGDTRFVTILRDHVDRGVIVSARASAALHSVESDAAA